MGLWIAYTHVGSMACLDPGDCFAALAMTWECAVPMFASKGMGQAAFPTNTRHCEGASATAAIYLFNPINHVIMI